MATTLRLDGDATGAVKATSDVAAAAQGLKGEFDKVGEAASHATGAHSEFSEGLEDIAHHFSTLVGPGALIAGAVEGIHEYTAALQEAADVAKNIPGLAGLAQLGPGQLQTARDLIATGVPTGEAAGIVQSMEGTSAVDTAYIRTAAPTNVFSSLPSMEMTARAYESQFGGTLPGLIAQASAASAGSGMNAEQMIAQINTLSPSFAATGISGQAGLAMTGEMAHIFGGEGTGRMQRFLQGGTTSGFFDYVPADAKNDPGKLLDYIRAQGTDDETLKSEFGGRGVITARSILGAQAGIEQRFQGIQAARPEDAYGMLSVAHEDIGLESGLTKRSFEGLQLTEQERRGLLRDVYRQIGEEQSYERTKGLNPLLGGPARFASWLNREASLLIDPEFQIRAQVENAAASGTIHNPELRGEATRILKAIENNTRNNGPVPSGLQE